MSRGAVIITGASRGLGASAARFAGWLGAPLVIGARTASALETVAEDVREQGGRVSIVVGDVVEANVQAEMVARAQADFGGISALVNNAATIQPIAELSGADADAWEAHWRLNVLAPVLLTRRALPALREARGRVINVSSGAAEKVTVGWGAYDVSKAALNHFTRQLAAEEPAVTAVALRPGAVDTEMQSVIRASGEHAMEPDSYARFVGLFERGELIPPDGPGRVLAMLALWAPHSLSGEFVRWDDPRVQALETHLP
jgi:NAD(P)-dependent dehydrogenase (short-subunit alcohol dehydrogenase family)